MASDDLRRRRFLRAAGSVALVAASSGCLADEIEAAEHEPEPLSEVVSPQDVDLPVQQRYGVAGDAVERAAAAGIEDGEGFAAFLEDEGRQVEALEPGESEGEPVLELEYVQTPSDGVVESLGLVAGGYAALVAADEAVEPLHATVLDLEGRPFGEFDVEPDWAEEFDAGELTPREYAGEVTTTLATTV